jgi:hypothetical protein
MIHFDAGGEVSISGNLKSQVIFLYLLIHK